MMLTNAVFITSQAWALRLYAMTFTFGVGLSNGLLDRRWIFALGCFLHWGDLAHRMRLQFDEVAKEGKFNKVPIWRLGTQAIWDQFRVSASVVTWKLISQLVVKL